MRGPKNLHVESSPRDFRFKHVVANMIAIKNLHGC